MTKFDVKEAAVSTSVQTVEELDALLGQFKKSNPAKYAAKVASGEFDALRKKLTPVKKEEKPVEKTVEKVVVPEVLEVEEKVEEKKKKLVK